MSSDQAICAQPSEKRDGEMSVLPFCPVSNMRIGLILTKSLVLIDITGPLSC